jgi:hypothetical protein
MNILKRLLLWVMGSSLPTCAVILVWLVTLQSFELIPVLHHGLFLLICSVITLIWGIVCINLDDKSVNDMIS